ncbi:MAG: hypothetical protein JW791_00700 [Nanoarchaeota archaeon]|nr:hypothetical protein [Nanoarchaeota archaeon]
MNKNLQELINAGLFSFGRERVVFELLKNIVNSDFDKEGDKSVITLRKGENKLVLTINKNKVNSFGDSRFFEQELEILRNDCMHEYANSVRSKKELINVLGTGRFYKFVIVPVIFEAHNGLNMKMSELCAVINNLSASKRFLFFKVKNKVKAEYTKDKLNVLFNNAQFSVCFNPVRIDYSLMDKNLDVSSYQNTTRDAFFAGLPYTLKVLDGEEFDFCFNGEENALIELGKTLLEAVYEYLMIENV